MKHALKFTFLALLAAFAALAAQRGFPAGQGELQGDPLNGALIYDNWILALDATPPQGDHPLWDQQDFNRRSGVVTWRCVECHGWDYKGADGAYGSYSTHYTGFPSLQDMVGATQEEVLDWLDGTINPDHNFLTLTNSTALNDLAAFLRTQQVDMDLLINPRTGASLGRRNEGREIYNANCVACHGNTGRLLDFGTSLEPLFLGDVAAAEPWQTVHKIRFGTATNSRMPASEDVGWSLRNVADLLAYLQTLPRANPDYQVINLPPDQPQQVERQAELSPIIWGALAIMLVVLGNVAWELYNHRWGED